MAWQFDDPREVSGLDRLKERLSLTFNRLANVVRCYERVATLAYGTTVRPSGDLTRVQLIEVTNTSPFTVANPINAKEGAEITLDFYNHSGGTMGSVTFGSDFSLDGAFVAPANGDHAVYKFYGAL